HTTTELYTLSLHDALPIFQVRPTRFVMNDSSHRDDASIRMNTRQRRLSAVLFFRLPLVATVAAFCVDRFLPERRILARLSITTQDRKSTRLNSSHRTISYA